MNVQKRSGPAPADMSNGTVDLPEWWVYRGVGEPLQDNLRPDRGLPPPPPWRTFEGGPVISGPPPQDDRGDIERRLGRGGAISPRWSITSRSTWSTPLWCCAGRCW
ncbi:hypothetical protein GCM10029964_091410 [Kibdelosporangium lantanae]